MIFRFKLFFWLLLFIPTIFFSQEILISDGEKYSCLEAKKQKNVLTGEPEIVYDTKDFWKELDHYRLFNNI